MNSIIKRYRDLLLFVLAYAIICFVVQFNDFSYFYIMLVWNIVLATLPLFFINASLLHYKKKKQIGAIIYGLLWFLFFPNSVYMITDFIHISNDKLIWVKESTQYSLSKVVMYSNDAMQWLKLLVIGVGVIYGILIGLESLYLFYCFIKPKIGKATSNVIVVGISLISGFAVYIGRFLRFNSWDLIKPLSVLKAAVASINTFTLQFVLIFTAFILIMFLQYIIFRKMKFEQE